MPRVGDDQLRVRVGARRAGARLVGDRRQPAAAVDQDRDASLGGEREHRRQPLVVQQEALRPRVQLDPARAEIEAARRLLDRLLAQVEAHERDQPAARALGERERAVVRGAEGGMPVGLVHAEHEGARDPVAVVDLLELLVDAAEAVDVVSEVHVRVEDLGPVGQLAPQFLVVTGDQLLGSSEHVFHRSRV